MKELDGPSIHVFARKGYQGGPDVPQAGDANGVKVRRIVQLVQDLSKAPVSNLRILDVGCAEGVYSIELGLRGAEVVGIDARTERMDDGVAIAARHDLTNVTFVQRDARDVTSLSHGSFDVILCLGLLYHLDGPSAFSVLENLFAMCNEMLLIDTLISANPDIEIEHRGRAYEGRDHREHEDNDPETVRRSRLLRSIDNTFSFRFTQGSLVAALRDIGFTAVLECHAPLEPGRAHDRITLVALKGEPVRVATYPWVNDLTEPEIARRLRSGETPASSHPPKEDPVWISRLFEMPQMLRMGHNQRSDDLNLGLGWLYYALGRIIKPRQVVVIGSWRGFVPIVLARACRDNLEPGEVTFIDPSMVDDFWVDPAAVRDYFEGHGLHNIRHFRMTTQEFVETDAYRDLDQVGLLFIDGFHSSDQARFDYEAFEGALWSRGVVMFHDSMIERPSTIYGEDKAYDIEVKRFVDELKQNETLQVFDLPFGTGLTLVRKRTPGSDEPLLDGSQGRPRPDG